MTATGTATADPERALAVIRYKTAGYSMEHPLHLPHPGRDILHHHTSGAGLADEACRWRLARLAMGPPGHTRLDGAQVVTATDYRPYESLGIPSSPDGDRLCAEFMDALLSDEVTKSIQESGPMAILAATDAIRQILASPDNPVGDRLAALAAAIPAKGGEAGPIIAEYVARHAMDETQATLMALRDYWAASTRSGSPGNR
ncbi:hypothetical protein ACFTZI_02185 [Streptomyces decoyicus]|uniref:hypothetical protein n=1 Tax=Streptomyces decoyicus TaxID=249567 RepID=UPI00362E9E35